jgi:hypothetical protein
LLLLIDEVSNQKGNEWFKEELKKKFSEQTSDFKDSKTNLVAIKQDTDKIKDYLSISPECSIDYSFITYNLLRTRLELDNLRMENVRLDLNEKDESRRLYDFIVNAFYQVENLINFYYYEKFLLKNNNNFEAFLAHLEQIAGFNFKRTEYMRNIGDIAISAKIVAFNKTFYAELNGDFTGINIDTLRLLRNEGSHRVTRIKNIETENKRLHDFLKFATFDTIHASVSNLANKIKRELNK